MKTINFFKAVAAIFIIAQGIFACTREEIPSADADDSGEYVEIPLKCVGEITDVEVSPLSRAGGNDLYYIKVSERYDIDTVKVYSQCAYGLFDNLDNAIIRLRKDHIYSFEVTAVKDGKDVIYKTQIDDFVAYNRPFMSLVTNTFVYTSTSSYYFMYFGEADVYGENGELVTYSMPPINRYFGILQDFVAGEGASISIDMVSMTFGLKVVAENLTEGSIKVSLAGAPDIILNSGEESKTVNLSLYYLYDNYLNDYMADYQEGQEKWWESSNLVVTWTDSQGTDHLIGERGIKYHRGMIKTIRVRLPQNGVQGNADISTEE